MITVAGSINMDIIARIDRYPGHGETRYGKDAQMLPGGKGANQAVTCARLGKETHIIGCTGDDAFGGVVLDSLKANGVGTSHLKLAQGSPTGVVLITIDDTAENTMIVVKGANEEIRPGDIEERIELLKRSKVLLVQMEIPHDTVIYAMKRARELGVFVILDPAPADGIQPEAVRYADLITPNRQETLHLTGIDVTDEQSALEAARRLEAAGARASIIKMAEKGSFIYSSGQGTRIPGIPVQAVDTVGAGDSFAGALAVALDEGCPLEEAVRFATVVSAIKVSNQGAQDGIPGWGEIEAFCRERQIATYRELMSRQEKEA
ncbi:ribokinase [Paenibacillus sp. URB8-2]|uniref:ribokinase n=1 Tax=Paenibacillus sp. URB8-2 TaxID=2741301 RepID=UPI0015BE7094|nr:ribokinase [Paenibacillus sp. URB8-2]BCG57570.1 ribokinase [Paenibacillus sp. URB8-2]